MTDRLARHLGISRPGWLSTPFVGRSQATRVAAARGMPASAVRALVASRTGRPLLGIIGERRVNVVDLNRALDRITSTGAKAAG